MTGRKLYSASEKPAHRIRPDLLGTVIPAEHGTLVRWAVKAGEPETPLHGHAEFEQISVLLEGRIRTTVDGETFAMGRKDVLYVGRGSRDVSFASDDAARPEAG